MTPDDELGAEADDFLSTDGLGIDQAALARYIVGECDPVESARIKAWLATSTRAHAVVRSLRAIWRSSADVARPLDAHAATNWEQLQARIQATPSSGSQRRLGTQLPRTPPQRTQPETLGARAARPQSVITALVVIILGVGLAVGSLRRRTAGASPGRTYVTAAGQRLGVMLVDGTRLTLAPASKVRIAANYGRSAGPRDIELEGEAYFAVAHDAAHPFAVRMRGVAVRDVGTAFDVRAYAGDAVVRVAVAEGRVDVETCSDRILRQPGRAQRDRPWMGAVRDVRPCESAGLKMGSLRVGDVASVSDTGVAVMHNADVAAATAWMQGEVVFNDTPLREVVVELRRWYGVSITFGDPSLGDRLYTAIVDHEPVDELLDALTASTATRYEWRADGTVVLYATDHHEGRGL